LVVDGVQGHGGGAVAAVAGPLHPRVADADLGEGVLDVDVGLLGAPDDRRFGGGGGGAADAVDLAGVRGVV